MNLSEEDVQKILKILDELEYGEIRLEVGDLKLHIQKARRDKENGTTFVRAPAAAKHASEASDRPAKRKPPAGTAPVESPTLRLVHAPTAGVFYRAAGPGEAPFVRVGQKVSAEDTVCLLEVMKLFQSIAAGVAGRIIEVLVENGEAVNQGQPLISIEIAP